MPRSTSNAASLPPVVVQSLKSLGENLAIARVRRKESQRLWAQRLGVSVPTLIRMERGEPAVSIGTYALALWMIGCIRELPQIADPVRDHGALELDVRKARERRSVRAAASIEARLGRKKKR